MTNLFIHPYFMQVLKKGLVSVYFFQSWMEDHQFCKRKKREKCWMAEFFIMGKPFCLSFFFLFFFFFGGGELVKL